MKSTLVASAHDYVFQLLEYCRSYPFHNPFHTKSVFERSTYLALNEDITAEDLEDLQIAALFHDTGFTEQYPKNEYVGSQIARRWLEMHDHAEERIEKIEGMIMATVLFSKPKTPLQDIIQDADMDNIGTKSAFEYSRSLLTEIREIAGTDVTDCAYWQFTFNVHNNFRFHTKTAQLERNAQLALNIRHLQSYLEMLECEVPKGQNHLERIV